MKELYKKYRPKKFSEIVGQDALIDMIIQMLEERNFPQATLFIGPSGTGKTTLARIIAKKLKCKKHDLSEMNCADIRGIDNIRDIRARMSKSPLYGKHLIWIIDEAHKLSNDAQNALLKMLEDTPPHVYFMLATTDPHKIIKTIKTRCTEMATQLLDDDDMQTLIKTTTKRDGRKVPKKVVASIVHASEGSARKGMVLLNKVIYAKSEERMLDLIEKATVTQKSIEIARILFKKKPKWNQVAKILKEVDLNNAESIRYSILGYAKTILLSGGPLSPQAYYIIDQFSDNLFNTKAAGLVAMCYAATIGMQD